MIFITVGTTSFPFARMIHIFEAVCENRHKDELVVFQHGATPVKTIAKNVVIEPYLDFATTNRYLCQARVVICHGGPSTIYQALSYGKVPWVFPREKQFGEHVDDHQVCFVRFMKRRKFILSAKEIIKNNYVSDTIPARVTGQSARRLIVYLESIV